MDKNNWFMRSALLLLFFSSVMVYAEEPVSKSFFGSKAINGYDSVAYHSPESIARHEARQGNSEFVVSWKGANWHFATAESAQKFRNNPTQYSPAYNGHCANALSLGEGLIKTDGTHWEILDKQLYLFYAGRGRQRWLDGSWQEYKKTADQAWLEIINSE